MEKVVLIQPKFTIISHVRPSPLGLGYITSFLEAEGYSVYLCDYNVDNFDDDTLYELINKVQPIVIGISVLTIFYKFVKRMIKKLKHLRIPIVVGGPHISALPEFSINDLGADFGVIGEGELTFLELVESIKNKKINENVSKIKGIVYKKDNKVILTKSRELIKDLDSLPFPAWHLMPPKKYRIAPVLATANKSVVAPIMTTRGCPYSCTYCASNIIWGRKLRFRSPKNVVDEIEFLIKNFGVEEIHISDDNFTFSKKHAMAVCDEIIKRNIKTSWGCPNGVRVDKLDEELLSKMKEAGCHMLCLGIESGSQKILRNVKKALDLSKVPQVIKKAKLLGITTFGYFMIGLPGETKETIRQTIDFSKKLDLDRAWYFILAPLPGSDIFKKWSENKRLKEINWDLLDTYTGIVKLPNLKLSDLINYQKKAVREFYLRPKILIRLLSNIKPRQIKTFLIWLKNRLRRGYET